MVLKLRGHHVPYLGSVFKASREDIEFNLYVRLMSKKYGSDFKKWVNEFCEDLFNNLDQDILIVDGLDSICLGNNGVHCNQRDEFCNYSKCDNEFLEDLGLEVGKTYTMRYLLENVLK